MKLNRVNVDQYKSYSSKFEWTTQRYVDFEADFKHVKYALRLRHDTRQFGLRFRLFSAAWPERVVACRAGLLNLFSLWTLMFFVIHPPQAMT